MAEQDYRSLVYAARDGYARSLGDMSPDVLAPLVNPSFMGGPEWPDLRQAWRVIRNGNRTIVMSDGLADPFSDEPEPNAGFELEVLAETEDPMPEAVQSTWLFNLVYQISQQCADHGGIREIIDRLGVVSMELPEAGSLQPAANADGAVGVLLGLPSPDFPTEFAVPVGTVRIVTAKVLWPSELDYVVAEGKAGREELARRFAADGSRHRSSLLRQPVV